MNQHFHFVCISTKKKSCRKMNWLYQFLVGFDVRKSYHHHQKPNGHDRSVRLNDKTQN